MKNEKKNEKLLLETLLLNILNKALGLFLVGRHSFSVDLCIRLCAYFSCLSVCLSVCVSVTKIDFWPVISRSDIDPGVKTVHQSRALGNNNLPFFRETLRRFVWEHQGSHPPPRQNMVHGRGLM